MLTTEAKDSEEKIARRTCHLERCTTHCRAAIAHSAVVRSQGANRDSGQFGAGGPNGVGNRMLVAGDAASLPLLSSTARAAGGTCGRS
ncbi:Hypothetical protein NTJ_06752 [Nesidiocoris tenuis]|uniref:Uncharacterized protein n=1 Tax=Nesidiocoris tenuis TaxID=355587 RepID=A0ABN7ANZ2_9HEMI|nr:Hypothetical protein NTJ_06752 [Nesidiocoris tenuis]